MLKVENLTFSYNKKSILDNVSFNVEVGEFVGIIGPNGSGKSTILKNIYRGLVPNSGKIILDNEDLSKMPYKKSAKKMAVVGQENELHFDFLVEEIVAMGRSPHKKLFEVDNQKDKEIVNNALKSLNIEDLAKRRYLNLSGGEKQRVIIARALAQESKFMVLDEASNHLDISYQMQIFELIRNLDVTVLAAIHDLNLAALFCDKLIVVKSGKIVLEGAPVEVLTSKNIFDIYGVHTVVENNKITGKLNISYLPNSVVKEELGLSFKEK